MSKKPPDEEIARGLADFLVEEELRALAKMSPEERAAYVKESGIDAERARAEGERTARVALQAGQAAAGQLPASQAAASQANVAGTEGAATAPSSKVVAIDEARSKRRERGRFGFGGVALVAAAAAMLGVVGAEMLAQNNGGGGGGGGALVTAAYEGGDAPVDEAATRAMQDSLRVGEYVNQAAYDCRQGRWSACLEDLDRAQALRPPGAGEPPYVVEMRAEARAALAEAGARRD